MTEFIMLVLGIVLIVGGLAYIASAQDLSDLKDGFHFQPGQIRPLGRAWWEGPDQWRFGCLPVVAVGALLVTGALLSLLDRMLAALR